MEKQFMEKRNSIRREKVINVWVYRDDNTVALAKTRNLTREGMYISVDSLLFPKDTVVEIAFAPENNKTKKRFCADVKHRDLNGIGINFREDLNFAYA